MQKDIKRRLLMAGVVIAGVTIGTLIVKALDPSLMYLLYKCGYESEM